jgi:hypothetical protein
VSQLAISELRRTLIYAIRSLSTLLYDSTTSLLHDAASYLCSVPPKAAPIPSQTLLLVTGTGGGLSRSLALHFASAGYQVMLQTPFQGQPGDLLAVRSSLQPFNQHLEVAHSNGARSSASPDPPAPSFP